MISGGLVMLLFYFIGWVVYGEFGAYSPLNIHPFIWASLTNLLLVVAISMKGKEPDGALIAKFFGT
jgi:hypothetical protein